MQNHLELPNRHSLNKINNRGYLGSGNKSVSQIQEVDEEIFREEGLQTYRSATPVPHDNSVSSSNSSPEKRNQDFSNFSQNRITIEEQRSSSTKRRSEWAFEEQELPNFPNETQSLRILVLTWNLYGKKPKGGLEKILNSNKIKHHIISIGTEECLRSIPASTFYESKSYWVNLLRNHLDNEYIMLKSHSMNALHLTVFVHQSIFRLVKGIESSEVKTGIGNVLGNKGGIGITMKICDTSFLFLNCHLASGQNKIKQRNEDFEKIMNELELPKARATEEKKMRQKSSIIDRFDYIFWSGDFNYRVNQTRESTIQYVKENKYETLLNHDQMTLEKRDTSLLDSFNEGEIKFPPTYKYQVGSNLLDNKKIRIPSWTDRILYRTKDSSKRLIQMSYQSLPEVNVSDHRPVFSQFLATFDTTSEGVDKDGLIKMKTKTCNIF